MDNITIRPNSYKTSLYFDITRDGGTNDVWVNVTLKQPLDRETLGDKIQLKLIITDMQHNEVQYESSVYIIDVNDNIPEFHNLPYKLEIDELPCYNKSLFLTNILATDKDSGAYGTISYSMIKAKDAHAYKSTFSINPTNASVSLHDCLDYEKNSYYHFVIMAMEGNSNYMYSASQCFLFHHDKDGGGLNSTADLIIHVKDVQDEPPFFTGKYRKAINGSIAKDEKIIRVNAVDGDLELSNDIAYSIKYSSCGDGLFSVDNHTGVVYAATNINGSSGTVSQQFGFCVLTIEASEIQTSYQQQYGNTTAVTDIILTLQEDIDYKSNINLTQSYANPQYSKNNIQPATKIPLTCQECRTVLPSNKQAVLRFRFDLSKTDINSPEKKKWDFENPCNKSNVLNGVTKFPHPDSINKFLICDVSGKTLSATCPKNEIFNARCSTCILPDQNFSKSCFVSEKNIKSLCSKENVMAGNLTFSYPDSTSKYIRCDNEGNAWEEECFSGSFWDQSNLICVLPEAYNPCHRHGNIVQTLYPHYCNPRLYVQCGLNGHPFVHSCPKNYVFLHYDLSCVPPGFPGSEYLRHTCN